MDSSRESDSDLAGQPAAVIRSAAVVVSDHVQERSVCVGTVARAVDGQNDFAVFVRFVALAHPHAEIKRYHNLASFTEREVFQEAAGYVGGVCTRAKKYAQATIRKTKSGLVGSRRLGRIAGAECVIGVDEAVGISGEVRRQKRGLNAGNARINPVADRERHRAGKRTRSLAGVLIGDRPQCRLIVRDRGCAAQREHACPGVKVPRDSQLIGEGEHVFPIHIVGGNRHRRSRDVRAVVVADGQRRIDCCRRIILDIGQIGGSCRQHRCDVGLSRLQSGCSNVPLF